jgi:replicative DNA helicase
MIAEARFNLPHDLDVEHQILGLALEAERKRRPRIWQQFCGLTPEDFFDPMHQIAWDAILRLHESGRPVTVATVLTETQNDQEMKRLLVECATNIIAWEGFETLPVLLKDMADKRRLIYANLDSAHRASTEGYTSPASDIAGTTISVLQSEIGGKRDLITPVEIIDDILDDLDKPVYATPTGMPRLDKVLLGGFHRGRYYGLSAEEKAGKTTILGPSISYNMARAGRRHVYIALEMRPREIFQRYMARFMAEETGSEITSDIFYDEETKKQKWFRDLLGDAKETFKSSGMAFLQRPRMHIDELKSTLARIGLSGEYEGVFIDYMQLIGGCKGDNMVSHLYNVNQTLAEIVTTYPMWICAAAQENDQGEVRYGKGMKAAVDMMLSLKKSEYEHRAADGSAVPIYKSRILMQASRYTRKTDIGSEDDPAYDFIETAGPHYRELPKGPVSGFMQGMQAMR